MKKVQKIIIIVYLILVAVAFIYVPWRVRLPSPNSGLVVSIGYAPLWSPPAYSIMSSKFSIIDYGKIILELIALTAIFGVLFVLISEVKTIRKGIIKLIIAYLVLVVLACTCIPCKVTYVVINEHTSGVRRVGSTYGCSFLGKPVFIVPILPGEEVKSSATSERRLIPYELVALTAIFGALFVLTLGPKKD